MADLDYVKVVGRLGITVVDGPIDPDKNPDIIYLDGGEVHFIPLSRELKVDGASPVPLTLAIETQVATIDAEGYLSLRGDREMWLVDLASPKVNPRIALGRATHRVEFRDLTAKGNPVTLTDFPGRFSLDNLNFGDAVDLTRTLPVPVAGGTAQVIGPRGEKGETGDTGPIGPDRFLVEENGVYPPRNDGDPHVFVGETNPETLGLMLLGDTWITQGTDSGDEPIYVLYSDLMDSSTPPGSQLQQAVSEVVVPQIDNPESEIGSRLIASIEAKVDEEVAPVAAAVETKADATRLGAVPTWATTANQWDRRLSLYNASPQNLSKWRAALSRAAGGLGTAHVTCFIDSITYGAAATGASNPKPVNSWPGRLRRMFDAQYGAAGSGIVVPWDTLADNPAHDPRWTFTGTISKIAIGPHKYGGVRWLSASDANYVEFTDTCTDFVLYTVGSGSRPRVSVDGAADKFIAGDANMDPTLTDYDPLPGYQSVGALGQIVTVVPAGALGVHTIRIKAPSNGTSYVNLIGIEARRTTTQGVRVSGMARNGIRMVDLIQDDTNFTFGMATSLDMAKADLAILLVSMNDFNQHTTVATFKSQVTTAIQRQRSSATNKANGDVLLVTPPQPDYANIPPDHVQTPAFSAYLKAMYEVADEQNAPLLDLAHRWKDFATSNALGYFADPLHPGNLGGEDIARAVHTALTTA